MANKTVCIEREYGSNGKKIAQWLAKNMGIAYYDKEALKKAAEENNWIPDSVTEDADGEYAMYAETIKQLAQKSTCIFVGTCAAAVLEGTPRNLNVFIKADMDSKIRWAMASEKVDQEKAKELIADTDKKREEYRDNFGRTEDGERVEYDLVISSSKFGIEGTSELIRSCLSRI